MDPKPTFQTLVMARIQLFWYCLRIISTLDYGLWRPINLIINYFLIQEEGHHDLLKCAHRFHWVDKYLILFL